MTERQLRGVEGATENFALRYFAAQIQPHKQDLARGLCVGQAPMFDRGPNPGETKTEQQHRIAHAENLCRKCPVLATCSANVPKRADGVWAGELYELGKPRKETA
ncbi:WhiB family transcriptional regulator [Corynebacterium aquatimens]|nr:WhiB family transcriptional regulator [Corynebacterium aquatimens]